MKIWLKLLIKKDWILFGNDMNFVYSIPFSRIIKFWENKLFSTRLCLLKSIFLSFFGDSAGGLVWIVAYSGWVLLKAFDITWDLCRLMDRFWMNATSQFELLYSKIVWAPFMEVWMMTLSEIKLLNATKSHMHL